MKNSQFGTDELMQEGFQEGVPSGKIGFRVVKNLGNGSSYHELVLENDQLWIQTTPENWAVGSVGDSLRLCGLGGTVSATGMESERRLICYDSI